MAGKTKRKTNQRIKQKKTKHFSRLTHKIISLFRSLSKFHERRRTKRVLFDQPHRYWRNLSIAIIEDRIGRLLALIYAAHVASTRS